MAQEHTPLGTTDFSAALQGVAGEAPDFLMFAVLENSPTLVQQARAISGLAGTPLGTFGELLNSADFPAQAGRAAEGVYATTPDFGLLDAPLFDFPNPDYQARVLPAYQARWGDPTSAYHAHAYARPTSFWRPSTPWPSDDTGT